MTSKVKNQRLTRGNDRPLRSIDVLHSPLRRSAEAALATGNNNLVRAEGYWFQVFRKTGQISLGQTLDSYGRPSLRDDRFTIVPASVSVALLPARFSKPMIVTFDLEHPVNGIIGRQDFRHLPELYEGTLDQIYVSLGFVSAATEVNRMGELAADSHALSPVQTRSIIEIDPYNLTFVAPPVTET